MKGFIRAVLFAQICQNVVSCFGCLRLNYRFQALTSRWRRGSNSRKIYSPKKSGETKRLSQWKYPLMKGGGGGIQTEVTSERDWAPGRLCWHRQRLSLFSQGRSTCQDLSVAGCCSDLRWRAMLLFFSAKTSLSTNSKALHAFWELHAAARRAPWLGPTFWQPFFSFFFFFTSSHFSIHFKSERLFISVLFCFFFSILMWNSPWEARVWCFKSWFTWRRTESRLWWLSDDKVTSRLTTNTCQEKAAFWWEGEECWRRSVTGTKETYQYRFGCNDVRNVDLEGGKRKQQKWTWSACFPRKTEYGHSNPPCEQEKEEQSPGRRGKKMPWLFTYSGGEVIVVAWYSKNHEIDT